MKKKVEKKKAMNPVRYRVIIEDQHQTFDSQWEARNYLKKCLENNTIFFIHTEKIKDGN